MPARGNCLLDGWTVQRSLSSKLQVGEMSCLFWMESQNCFMYLDSPRVESRQECSTSGTVKKEEPAGRERK